MPGRPVHHLSKPMPVCLWHSLSGRGGPQVPCRPGVSTQPLAGLQWDWVLCTAKVEAGEGLRLPEWQASLPGTRELRSLQVG